MHTDADADRYANCNINTDCNYHGYAHDHT